MISRWAELVDDARMPSGKTLSVWIAHLTVRILESDELPCAFGFNL